MVEHSIFNLPRNLEGREKYMVVSRICSIGPLI